MTYLEAQDPHEAIDAENVVERYVLGKLDEREQSEFEDHFVGCPRCLEAVELAQELRHALADHRAATAADPPVDKAASATADPKAGGGAEELVPFPSSPSPWRTPAVWLPAAAVLLISLLPSAFLFQSRNQLQQQVEQLQQPWIAGPDAVLEVQREATSEPSPSDAVTITPRPGSPWISLTLELGPAALPTGAGDGLWLDLELSNAQGEQLWTRTGLSPPDQGRLTLSAPSSLLTDGAHFQIDAIYRYSERPEACRTPCEGDRSEPIGSFRFALSKIQPGENEPRPQ